MEKRLRNVKQPEHGFDIKFKNGILRDGRFIEVDSTEFTPYYIHPEFDCNAEPVPIVDEYLDLLTEGDEDTKKLVLESMAHCLITDPEVKGAIKKFIFYIGNGKNGKGTLLKIVSKLLGSENCSSVSLAQMADVRYFVTMKGKLVNLADDVENKPITVQQMKLLKNLATCDRVATRELFKQSSDDVLTTSLMFTSNHLLKTHEKGDAYKRRVLWCPMFNRVAKADPRFITKLTHHTQSQKILAEAHHGGL